MKNKKFLDRVLVVLALFLLAFIISIEVMYYIVGSAPDALIIGVLGCGGAETIVTAIITIVKFKTGFKSE